MRVRLFYHPHRHDHRVVTGVKLFPFLLPNQIKVSFSHINTHTHTLALIVLRVVSRTDACTCWTTARKNFQTRCIYTSCTFTRIIICACVCFCSDVSRSFPKPLALLLPIKKKKSHLNYKFDNKNNNTAKNSVVWKPRASVRFVFCFYLFCILSVLSVQPLFQS